MLLVTLLLALPASHAARLGAIAEDSLPPFALRFRHRRAVGAVFAVLLPMQLLVFRARERFACHAAVTVFPLQSLRQTRLGVVARCLRIVWLRRLRVRVEVTAQRCLLPLGLDLMARRQLARRLVVGAGWTARVVGAVAMGSMSVGGMTAVGVAERLRVGALPGRWAPHRTPRLVVVVGHRLLRLHGRGQFLDGFAHRGGRMLDGDDLVDLFGVGVGTGRGGAGLVGAVGATAPLGRGGGDLTVDGGEA